MAEAKQASALAGREAVAAGGDSAITIAEIDDRGMIDLRLDPADGAALAAVEKLLGFALPSEPRTASGRRGRQALWWSVDQWLITCARKQATTLAAKLEEALKGHFAMVTDMSDARAVIRITGDAARTVMMKGSSADLLGRDIGAGYVRRTQIGDVAIAIHIVDLAPGTIDVYGFRSYADFVWQWLVTAGRSAATVEVWGAQEAPAV
jgi:sarcosine oxidase subunit gamma